MISKIFLFIPSMQDSLVPLPPQPIGVLPQNPCRGVPPSSAPPAHQSPKPSRSSSTSSGSGAPPAGSVGPTLVRQVPAEPLMYVSPNKRTKYSVQPPAMSPQSILRNQLQIAKEVAQQQQQQQAQQQQLMQQQTQPQQLNMSQVKFIPLIAISLMCSGIFRIECSHYSNTNIFDCNRHITSSNNIHNIQYLLHSTFLLRSTLKLNPNR